MSQFYNIIASANSRNSYSGHGKIGLVLMDEKEIIAIAQAAAGREGYSLEHYAGINSVGIGQADEDGDFAQYGYERDWNDGEELESSVDYWTRDGYVYEIFKCGEQDQEFINRAADFDLKDEAEEFAK